MTVTGRVRKGAAEMESFIVLSPASVSETVFLVETVENAAQGGGHVQAVPALTVAFLFSLGFP